MKAAEALESEELLECSWEYTLILMIWCSLEWHKVTRSRECQEAASHQQFIRECTVIDEKEIKKLQNTYLTRKWPYEESK